MDRRLFSYYDWALVNQLLATEFTVRYDNAGILLAERTLPGGRGDSAARPP